MSDLYLPRPERLRFRFGLRTFFILLTVFGVWLGVQVKWKQDRHEALEWLRSGRISSPWLRDRGGYLRSPSPYVSLGKREMRKAPWGLRLLGERGIAHISLFPEAHYRTKEFRSLFPEAEVEQQHVVELTRPNSLKTLPEVSSTLWHSRQR